jgi:RNA polymerase sigma factor (TIGR02999 family)
MIPHMSDVTQILNAVTSGDAAASSQLLPLVYDDLRKLAAWKLASESPGQTLQPTALVHEAWLRLAGDDESQWDSRGHFFAAAAEAMRRILVDNARRKGSLKRGGDRLQADIDVESLIAAPEPFEDLLALDDVLNLLATADPEAAQLVKLRYFVGLSLEESAGILNVSPRTADRLWAYARAWLHQALEGGESNAR